MSGVDFVRIIQHQQQHNDEHLDEDIAEVISEDLSCIKCHPQDPKTTVAFRGFWYISRQICDAFADYSGKTQEYLEQVRAYYQHIDSSPVEDGRKLIKAVLYTVTYEDLPIQESHELIFYLSSAATKTKGFTEVIKDPLRFIADLKTVYQSIKEIKRPEGSKKGKETATPITKKYFEVLKSKPPRTTKALNTPTTSRKPSSEPLIEFSPEASPLVSPTLSTTPVRKLNLTTLETTSESSLSGPKSSSTTTRSNSSNSSNIMAGRGKMIVRPQEFHGKPGEDPKAWYDNFIIDAAVNGWEDDQILDVAAGFFKGAARE